VWRIGWLSPAPGPGRLTQSLLEVMQERGYLQGKNLNIVPLVGGQERAARAIRRRAGPHGRRCHRDGGHAGGPGGKQATSTIPIVFAAAGAPIEMGLVSSLGRPARRLRSHQIVAIRDSSSSLRSRCSLLLIEKSYPEGSADDLQLAAGSPCPHRCGARVQPTQKPDLCIGPELRSYARVFQERGYEENKLAKINVER
jgi:hypothetical protein